MITPTLETIIHGIFVDAKNTRHEFVTIEHLLLGLLQEETAKQALLSCGMNIQILHNELVQFLKDNVPSAPADIKDLHTQPTLGFQRVLQRAIMHIQSTGKSQVTGADILVAMFSEKDSHAVYFMQQQNINRLDVVNYLSHGITKKSQTPISSTGNNSNSGNGNNNHGGAYNHGKDGKSTNYTSGQNLGSSASHGSNSSHTPDEMDGFLVNLNEQVQYGKIDPLIGRSAEVERVVQILCRRRKNNPLLVGEAGVGKTAIAEGLAYKIVNQQVPSVLEDAVVYAVDMCNLLAGTRYRGDFEQRIKNLIIKIKAIPNAILFVDEIHTLIGAGASSGSSVDAGNLLKPVLSSGELRCLGATTFDEYRKHFEKEAALSRRFQKVDVLEPSQEDTIEILEGLRSRLESHHQIKYSSDAIKAAVELSVKHINDRFLPDKAIDVLDEAGAAQQILSKSSRSGKKTAKIAKTITRTEIEAVVAKIARVPIQSISIDDRQKLKDLTPELKSVIFGQDKAIEVISNAIKLSKAGLGNEEKPIGSFLFAGPTGVGKTEVAKQLANTLGISFLRFDMSEYMERHAVSRLIGSPPGYVGYEEGGLLTEAINKSPHCILLLDEIEKAHPDIFNLLLQVMDHGVLTDNNGRKAHFKNVVLIMTSNVGAQDMQKNTMGFTTSKDSSDNPELKKLFTPEFRNRLSSIVQFNALNKDTIMLVVNKFLAKLAKQLQAKKVEAIFSDELKEYLATKGYEPSMGARPMERLIQDTISRALAEELLFGRLSNGGIVEIGMNNGEIKLEFISEYTAEVQETYKTSKDKKEIKETKEAKESKDIKDKKELIPA
jgi:ATP-dependent Clp protease ATP-binding subunit ClpA